MTETLEPSLSTIAGDSESKYCTAARPGGAAKGEQPARDTSEDTCNRDRHRPASAEEAEEGHRHYDEYAARHVEPGRWLHSKEPGSWVHALVRRANTNLAVPRDFYWNRKERDYKQEIIDRKPS